MGHTKKKQTKLPLKKGWEALIKTHDDKLNDINLKTAALGTSYGSLTNGTMTSGYLSSGTTTTTTTEPLAIGTNGYINVDGGYWDSSNIFSSPLPDDLRVPVNVNPGLWQQLGTTIPTPKLDLTMLKQAIASLYNLNEEKVEPICLNLKNLF